jgi:hypothetical protein
MKITKVQALEIAREECARRGLPWIQPVKVHWGFFNYLVFGGDHLGGNLMVVIRKRDGKVLSAGVTPM